METQSPRPSRSMLWTYILIGLVALAVVGLGIWLGVRRDQWSLLAAGTVGLLVTLAVGPLAVMLQSSRREQGTVLDKIHDTLDDRLQQMSILLNLISEQQLLSDRAKAVAFREKDRDALRRAITEEIARCDWEAAESLVRDIESNFGYRQEAERFREEIARCRAEAERKSIMEAMTVIDRYTRAEQWAEAMREAQVLQQRFPNSVEVQNLPQEIENRREQHKQRLITSWHDAVARKDVDGSIEILKQLDLYLTPQEAESMQETARTVFKEKLNLLRLQFAAAVQEHNWGEAVDLGDQIMRDFPNTRIAQEVREKMDALRQRAAEPEPATKT